jgi:hypothetical protein
MQNGETNSHRHWVLAKICKNHETVTYSVHKDDQKGMRLTLSLYMSSPTFPNRMSFPNGKLPPDATGEFSATQKCTSVSFQIDHLGSGKHHKTHKTQDKLDHMSILS